jgi:SSS family solute:Na+ symporter
MALTFWLIGKKVWELGKLKGLVTPAELVRNTYGSRPLALLFATVMIVFTIPYLALQPMAAGYVLKELFGIPDAVGATIITLVIVLYTFRGGLRAVAWTDIFQGLLMVTLMVTAFVLVTQYYGGLGAANEAVRESNATLLARPGGQGRFDPALWFSFLMLWFFCDPMFPQLFQRFFSARSVDAIKRTMLLYPAVCTLVFILPVTLGVLGHLSFPGLAGKGADRILPLMLTELCGDFMGTLVMSAGLAALMSTMDSQLLTLSSMFTRDVYPIFARRDAQGTWPGKVFVLILGALGLFFAVNPASTIIHIATQAFTGLAVLFPTVLFGLYSKQPRPLAAFCSILIGEGLVVLSYAKLLPSGGFLPAVPVMAATFAVYLAVAALQGFRPRALILPQRRTLAFGCGFLLIFLLGVDWWQWPATSPIIGGYPYWMSYFVLLSAAQTVLMARWLAQEKIQA